jgi:hypothetical protein
MPASTESIKRTCVNVFEWWPLVGLHAQTRPCSSIDADSIDIIKHSQILQAARQSQKHKYGLCRPCLRNGRDADIPDEAE